MSLEQVAPYIGGARYSSRAETFQIVNPASGTPIAEVVRSGREEADAAVEAAAKGRAEWSVLSPYNRARALWTWGDHLEANAAELAALDVEDTGKTITDAMSEVSGAARVARYWAGGAERILGNQIPALPGHLSYTRREPLGVIANILAWNGPTASCVARSAPALACGNAVVVKPSEYSPRSAFRVVTLAEEAGIPAGALNVLPGDGSTGAIIASHPGIGGVSFTGSVETGRKVAQAAVSHFAKPLMELGGKSPNIVFGDCDLNQAIRSSTWSVFQNAGQICVAGTRLLVADDIADEFVEGVRTLVQRIRVGDPTRPDTHIGPVVSERQYERVCSYIDAGSAEGAKIATGGSGHPPGTNADGFYVHPTIFTDVDPTMRIASEEIFGPVLTVIRFHDEAEAIEIANSLDYGLSAYVWTNELDRALRLVESLQAGIVLVNSVRAMDPALPFGGFKNSGIGNAHGRDVIEAYTQTKRVSINFAGGVAASF
jgi:acyl-CoA reductase-like NAD-dependent aldehyde dehydrogenase